MIKYQVRSRQLLDIVKDIKEGILIKSPYFQRKLVWRNIHKMDFIKTILLGFPFPEIFIANGDIDVEKMITTSYIVDGQQRMNSIVSFINNEFSVDDRFFKDFTVKEKEDFFRYEIALIELSLKYDDSQIQEIFMRLNRTFYSLSNIEKVSSEYGACEFILVAKLLTDELFNKNKDEDDVQNNLLKDPNVTEEFINWAKNKKIDKFKSLINDYEVFTGYELSRQVHLNFVINIMGIIIQGFYNRNLKKEILELYTEEFPEKDAIVNKLECVANYILKLKLKKKSYWHTKSNMFSLIIAIYNNYEYLVAKEISLFKKKLEEFGTNIPTDYELAAREGVNNKKERLLRNEYIEKIISKI